MNIMGMVAKLEKLELRDTTFETSKTMTANPKKIADLEVMFDIETDVVLFKEKQEKSQRDAIPCSVILSLHPETAQAMNFTF